MDHNSPAHERRRHPRFDVGDNVLVFSSDTFGQILNISKSGLAYRFLTVKDDWIDSIIEIGFLNTETGFYLDKLNCKIITSNDSEPIHPSSSTLVRTNGVEFINLTDDQHTCINNFLSPYLTAQSAHNVSDQ